MILGRLHSQRVGYAVRPLWHMAKILEPQSEPLRRTEHPCVLLARVSSSVSGGFGNQATNNDASVNEELQPRRERRGNAPIR